MGSDKPFACIFVWHGRGHVLLVVVGREVEWVRAGDVIIEKGVWENDPKLLFRVIGNPICIFVELFVGTLGLLHSQLFLLPFLIFFLFFSSKKFLSCFWVIVELKEGVILFILLCLPSFLHWIES